MRQELGPCVIAVARSAKRKKVYLPLPTRVRDSVAGYVCPTNPRRVDQKWVRQQPIMNRVSSRCPGASGRLTCIYRLLIVSNLEYLRHGKS